MTAPAHLVAWFFKPWNEEWTEYASLLGADPPPAAFKLIEAELFRSPATKVCFLPPSTDPNRKASDTRSRVQFY